MMASAAFDSSASTPTSAASPAPESTLYCNSCGISLDSAVSRGAHYRSEWHRYNLKRRCAGMTAIAERSFNEQLQSLQERKQNHLQLTSVRKCELCQSSFNSLSAFQIHLKSRKHLKRENYKKERTNSDKERESDKEAQAEEKEENEEEEATSVAPSTTSDSASPSSPSALSESTSSASASTLSSALRKVHFADDGKNDGKNEDENDDEGSAEDGEEEFTGEAIVPGVCLFCPTDFGTDYSACLAHMLKRHGFFVPFLEQLRDVEGFLTYMGAKIGTGNFCIYCLARFPDQAAVQQHMNAKNHCKIRLEDEEDEEEIMEFFEFESEKAESKDAAAAAANSEQTSASTEKSSGRRPLSVNSMGELIMSDGSIIGTRDLKRYYKQNLRNTPSNVAALPAADSASNSASSDGSVQRVDSASQAVVVSSIHPRQLHGRALESKYLRKLQRVALRTNLASNKQKHFRKSTP